MANICERMSYKSSNLGLTLKQKVNTWYSTIEDFRSNYYIGGSNKLYDRLNNANFASALLSYGGTDKYYYSHSAINDLTKKNSLQGFINKAQRDGYDVSFIQDIYNNLAIKTTTRRFSYVRVDAYRSVETNNCRDRFNDTESMILENILEFVTIHQIQDFKVYLFTFLEPCLCCDKNIIEFLNLVPTCTMQLYYDKPYNKLV